MLRRITNIITGRYHAWNTKVHPYWYSLKKLTNNVPEEPRMILDAALDGSFELLVLSFHPDLRKDLRFFPIDVKDIDVNCIPSLTRVFYMTTLGVADKILAPFPPSAILLKHGVMDLIPQCSISLRVYKQIQEAEKFDLGRISSDVIAQADSVLGFKRELSNKIAMILHFSQTFSELQRDVLKKNERGFNL